jgi:hypothetical protein
MLSALRIVGYAQLADVPLSATPPEGAGGHERAIVLLRAGSTARPWCATWTAP